MAYLAFTNLHLPIISQFAFAKITNGKFLKIEKCKLTNASPRGVA